MNYYKIYGVVMASDVEFPQLVEVKDNLEIMKVDISVYERIVPERLKNEDECFSKIDKKESYFSNSYCYFWIKDGKELIYQEKKICTTKKLSSYILGWGLAILFYQRDMLSIHCSCVSNDRGAVLISGLSGSGKSTITNTLLKDGYNFMADDVAVVDVNAMDELGNNIAIAYPAFPFQKLCLNEIKERGISTEDLIYVDEKKDKYLVPYDGTFSTEGMKVIGIIVLGYTLKDDIEVKEITGAKKFMECMKALFLAPLLKGELYDTVNGEKGLKLASLVPMYEILRPRDKDTKDKMINAIKSIISKK